VVGYVLAAQEQHLQLQERQLHTLAEVAVELRTPVVVRAAREALEAVALAEQMVLEQTQQVMGQVAAEMVMEAEILEQALAVL
tara:strand:+ start:540 stop:788 length:249 start_codon:yes stop_codon:yes gene_type:complete